MDIEVWRETTPDRMNRLINMPEIRPWVHEGNHPLDISGTVANPANHLVMGEYGGVLFGWLVPGIYEAHPVVHPAARGRWTKGMLESATHYMFTRTDAYEISTRIPQGHTAAMAAAQGTGMKFEFTLLDAVTFKGTVRSVHIWSYRIQDWMIIAPGLEKRGEWFHRRLAQEAVRLGIQVEPLDDLPVHNRYIGAYVDMAFAEQLAKGTVFYNRYAMMARQRTISLAGPDRINFYLGTLVFRNDDIEIIPHAVS